MRHTLLTAEEAAKRLHAGEVIAYPTEAVFGLGCDPENEAAVLKLLSLKHRPVSAGLILIGSAIEQFSNWIGPVSESALQRARASWPGPTTWIFPRGSRAPDWITGAHDSLAIRVTAHSPSIALCEAFGGPVVSTSANPRSCEPARTVGELENYFGEFIAGTLEGALGGRKRPSEIRDVRQNHVLREG